MTKPPYRTVFVVVAFAIMGGLVCGWVHGDFSDYALLLKALGWAVAFKSLGEHGANIFTKPEPPK